MPAKFLTPNTLVEVTWNDAWYIAEDDGDEQPLQLKRVGYVVVHKAQGIKFAKEIPADDRGKTRHISFIPSGMIVKLRVLK